MTSLTEQGLKDGLSELAKLRRLLDSRIQDAEARFTAAEQDAAEMRKLVGFVNKMTADYGARLEAGAACEAPTG